MVNFTEIQKLFPAKLSKENAAELNNIRKKMNSLKTEAEKEAYFEELKRQYAPSSANKTAKEDAAPIPQKKEEKTTRQKKKKSRYNKNDLKQIYGDNQDLIDITWEYLQHLPDSEKKNSLRRKKKKQKFKKNFLPLG